MGRINCMYLHVSTDMQTVESQMHALLTFSFSRIARSTSHLLKILQKCKDHKTRLVSITEQIDTNSPMGMALFTILGALSQLERELIRERVRAGLAAARMRGKQIGRKKLRDSVLIRSLLKSGLSFRKIAVIAKCSHGSISTEKKDMVRDEAKANAKIEEQMKLLPSPAEREVGPAQPDISPT
jgi:DNA invertase Pin-like site-specific DNA recombinase